MMSRLALVFCIGLFTAGAQFSCSSDGNATIRDDDIDSGDGPRFRTTLILRNSSGTETYSFQRGDLINFHLTIQNRTSETITFQGCCPPESDFFVFPDGDEEVLWQWSDNRPFPPVFADLVFMPNETKTFHVNWTQVTESGETLAAGRYDVRGVVTRAPFSADPMTSSELGSNLRTFTIR